MKIKSFFALLVLTLVFCSCVYDCLNKHEGIVLDSDKKPIEGVNIQVLMNDTLICKRIPLDDVPLFTDSNGYYSFSFMTGKCPKIRLIFLKAGYIPKITNTLEVRDSLTIRLENR